MTREDLIYKLCREYQPNYDKLVVEKDPTGSNVTAQEQAEIYHKMMFLYDNVICKYMRFK